jgi:hypothetical protein
MPLLPISELVRAEHNTSTSPMRAKSIAADFLIRILAGDNYFVLFSCDCSCLEVDIVCVTEMAFDCYITSMQELFACSCLEMTLYL